MPQAEVRLVVFFFELPQPLAIEDGSTFTFQTDEQMTELGKLDFVQPAPNLSRLLLDEDAGNVVVSFRIWQIDASQLTEAPYLEATRLVMHRVLPEIVPLAPPDKSDRLPLQLHRTVIEAVSPIRMADYQNELTVAFDRCERYLWKLVDSYRIVAPRMIDRVARELLPSWIPFITRDIAKTDGWDEGLSFFHLNWNVPHGEPPLGPDEMKKFGIILSHTIVEHPFAAYSLRSKEAGAALSQRGDTADTVVKGQIAAEVLLDTVLMAMMWEEGVDPVEGARIFREEGLGKRVRSHYGLRLGGNWDTNGNGVMAQWNRRVASLRGRIVHGNYTPTRDEARKALAALQGVDRFVRQRLAAKKNRYKRTTLMLLGQPGLEKLNSWSGEIVTFVEREADKEPDWRLSLKEWREHLNQAR